MPVSCRGPLAAFQLTWATVPLCMIHCPCPHRTFGDGGGEWGYHVHRRGMGSPDGFLKRGGGARALSPASISHVHGLLGCGDSRQQ